MANRCWWVTDNPLMIEYHDNEWGVPLHDDRKLFEYIVLDTFQAGLSWEIIINKRSNLRTAFHNFNPLKISKYKVADISRLMRNPGIIRNRMKIESAINNANKFLEIKKEFGSFDRYIWQFTNYKTIKNNFKHFKEIPARTEHSDNMSLDLKKRGFKFAGSTICYAFMQACGMVHDHTTDCIKFNKDL